MDSIVSTGSAVFMFILGEFGWYGKSFYKGFKNGWLYTPLLDYFSLNTWPYFKPYFRKLFFWRADKAI